MKSARQMTGCACITEMEVWQDLYGVKVHTEKIDSQTHHYEPLQNFKIEQRLTKGVERASVDEYGARTVQLRRKFHRYRRRLSEQNTNSSGTVKK